MKKLASFALLTAVIGLLSTGCAIAHKSTITANPNGTYTTNTTAVVNESNLALDCVAVQGATAIAVNVVLVQTKHDAGVIESLKNAKLALDGILLGSNQQTTQQVLELLKANGNPALQQQLTQLIDTASKLEQGLIQKYGVTVAGEIALSILKSIDAGLAIGLAGA